MALATALAIFFLAPVHYSPIEVIGISACERWDIPNCWPLPACNSGECPLSAYESFSCVNFGVGVTTAGLINDNYKWSGSYHFGCAPSTLTAYI